MRRALLIAAAIASAPRASPIGPARADDIAVMRRNDAESQRLSDLYARTYLAEVAGFNHRHAICDQTKAQAMDEFDRKHRTTFKRTLGWRWDAASARFVVAPPAQSDVTVSFVGPVRSGWLDIGGKEVWYCRAEAPDRLEATAKLPPPYTFETSRQSLPALLPGFVDLVGAEHVADAPAEIGPVTPQPQIDARVAEAAALLEPERIAPSLEPRLGADCPEAKAREELERSLRGAQGYMSERRSLRRGTGDAWEKADEAEAEVSLDVRRPAYYGPISDGDKTRWVCAAAMPGSATASARWQQEGDVTLSFHLPASPEP